MNQQPLVSVVIPVYNAEQFLGEALESVLAQTYEPIEVIAVNDGSTDGSEDVLNKFSGRVKCFRQKNGGEGSARNLGIAHASGEWIAFQDADDLWDPNKLEMQLSAASDQDDVIHTDMRRIDDSGHVLLESWNSTRDIVHAPATLLDMLVGCGVLMSTAVVRRRALENVGGFDGTNRWRCVDFELWLCLAATGHGFRYVDKPLASYRLHDSNWSLDRKIMHRGEIYALRQTYQRYRRRFGKREATICHNRLWNYDFGQGWHLYNKGDYDAAGKHFWAAVRHKPFVLRPWVLASLCSLPFRSRLVPVLRAMKGRTP